MAINFPSNPTDLQTYSYSGQNWFWSNTAGVWKANTSAIGYTGSLGYTGSQGANSKYTVSSSAPAFPIYGDRWFHSDYGIELVYTYDGDSAQWVEIAASGFVGYTGSLGPTGYTGSAASGISTGKSIAMALVFGG